MFQVSLGPMQWKPQLPSLWILTSRKIGFNIPTFHTTIQIKFCGNSDLSGTCSRLKTENANFITLAFGCLVNFKNAWSLWWLLSHTYWRFINSKWFLSQLRTHQVIPLALPWRKSGDKIDSLNDDSNKSGLLAETKTYWLNVYSNKI